MLTLVKERGVVNKPKLQENPVADLWEIELLYGKHPLYTENTYAVIFKTRLEGNASKCYLVIELRERFDEILRELNVFGELDKVGFHKSIDYVRHLKVNGQFTRVPNLLTVMEGAVGVCESLELFETVVDCVLNDRDAFPTISSDAYKHGESTGIILDTDQYVEKYGSGAVGITTEALYEMLSLEGSTKNARLLEIARGWRDQELLLHKTKQNRLQEPIKPNISSKAVKRFYIFRIDGLA